MPAVLITFLVGFFSYFDYGMVGAILISFLVMLGFIFVSNTDSEN